MIQYQDGGYHIRCPFCFQRLFSSDVPTWRAVAADDPAQKLAIKCPQRGSRDRCGIVHVLTWQPEMAATGDVTGVTEA